MRQFVKFAAVFSLALSISLQSAVSAHEFGSKTSLTPPIIRYAEEAERLKSAIGPSGPALRGVYNQMKLWPSGTTLRGCFYDSDQQLRSYFLQAANRWLPGTSLRTDFGDASRGFRSCT